MAKLTTELKDLDVDRVDGVDRPATGRSFALYKSETTKKGTTMEVTKDQLSQLMKNYAAVATAADMLLKALRKDAAGKVSKSTAIAVNGLAQIMGADPVFKAVPGIANQPYEIEDPMRDENKRGPADEDLGANFTPRSMPGSMVGRVQFSVKGAAPVTQAPAVADEAQAPAKQMPWDDAKMSKAIEEAVTKALAAQAKTAPIVEKVVKTEAKAEGKAPESKQVMTDEQRQVRKSAGYRFENSYADVVFGPARA